MIPEWRRMSVRGPTKSSPTVEEPDAGTAKAKRPKAAAAKASAKPAAKAAGRQRKTLGGPELKMPSFRKRSLGGGSLKAPAPLAGAVEALREQRMLPLIVLLVVAIVAVPFVLGNGKKAPAVRDAAAPTSALAALGPGGSAVAVANQSGVRDYKSRLPNDAKDPFRDSYAQSQPDLGAGAGTGTGTSSGGVSSSSSGATSGATPVTAQQSGRAWLTHDIDLYAGSADAKRLRLREGVEEGAILPNQKQKVAAYIGVPFGTPNVAWFALSPDLEIVRNEGKCNLSGCGVVGLNPGEVLKLEAFSGRVWIIKLAAINRVISSPTPK